MVPRVLATLLILSSLSTGARGDQAAPAPAVIYPFRDPDTGPPSPRPETLVTAPEPAPAPSPGAGYVIVNGVRGYHDRDRRLHPVSPLLIPKPVTSRPETPGMVSAPSPARVLAPRTVSPAPFPAQTSRRPVLREGAHHGDCARGFKVAPFHTC